MLSFLSPWPAKPAPRVVLSDVTPYTKELIMSNTKQMFISNKCNTQQILHSNSDCVGIAVFLDNKNKTVMDNGIAVKSGYILVSNKTLPPTASNGSRHMQVYESIFRDLKDRSDCYIFGFGLQNGSLKGRSGTFNAKTHFEQKLLSERKEGLFYFRLVTFGAILSFKFAHKRTPSTYCSALCLCLFQIIKQCGDEINLSQLRIKEINIDHLEEMKVIFKQLGVHEQILKVACQYDEMWRIVRWARAKVAMYYLFEALKTELTEHEFNTLMGTIMKIFEKIDQFVAWLKTLMFGQSNGANQNQPAPVLEDLDDYKEETVTWSWYKHDWVSYGDEVTSEIEDAYKKGDHRVMLNKGVYATQFKDQYQILFKSNMALKKTSIHCIDNHPKQQNVQYFHQKNIKRNKYRICRRSVTYI